MPDASDEVNREREGELEDLARDEVSLLSVLLAPNRQGEALRQSLMLALGLDERSGSDTDATPPSEPSPCPPPAEATVTAPAPQPADGVPTSTAATAAAPFVSTASNDVTRTAWPMARLGLGAAANNPHALVVDDTVMVREHTVKLLERLGYTVTAAENGPMALRLLKGIPRLDLLVTDVVMPLAMNGRELAEKVKEQHPETAIVFVSGFADLGVEERVGLPASVNLLAKPFTRDEFNDAINSAVREAQASPDTPAIH
ncbi:response regulator [Acuticoccus sediminis]|uniref:response regulator n=1 Tax=Acuticoccus sediminis TaxID=2184697 RepID=UPI0021F570AB|nr:response regulator [Acuticoccus sediminis]